jgi:uncharacterized DUF497 family protein
VCEEPVRFEWDTEKEKANVGKRGVDFTEATAVFYDPQKLIQIDAAHSGEEPRLLCIGRTERGILSIRFTYLRRHHSDHRRRLLEERQENL